MVIFGERIPFVLMRWIIAGFGFSWKISRLSCFYFYEEVGEVIGGLPVSRGHSSGCTIENGDPRE